MKQVTITARLRNEICAKCGKKPSMGEVWYRNYGKRYRYYVCPECYEKSFVDGVSVVALCAYGNGKVELCDQRRK